MSALSSLTDASADEQKYFDDTVAAGRSFKTRFTCVDAKVIAKKLEDLFHKTEFWEKVSDACLSCGVCTFVCPTCYCFDICDETLFSQGPAAESGMPACLRISRWRPAATIPGQKFISVCARKYVINIHSTSENTA